MCEIFPESHHGLISYGVKSYAVHKTQEARIYGMDTNSVHVTLYVPL